MESEDPLTPERSQALRIAATRSTFLLSGTTLFTYAASFGSTLVLARLLTPRQFGEVALAVVIAEFLFLLGGLSLPIALIREPEASIKAAFDASIFLTCWIAAAVAVISALIGVGLWRWYSSGVALMFVAISASRVLVLFGALFLADLERRLSYGRFAIALYGSTLLSIVVAIPLGYAGAGVWSLASREIVAGCSMLAVALVLVRWRPGWVYNRAKVRQLLRFGTGMLGSRLGDVMFHRFDNLMVGALAGPSSLGLYNQAYVLTDVGVKVLYPAIYQVPMPTYSRLQGDRRLSSQVFRVVAFCLSRAVIPISVLFLVIPGQFLSVVLGDQWRPAEHMLRGLAVYGLLIPLVEHARIVLIAHGAVRQVLVARLIQLAFFVPATVVATWLWGGNGTAIVVAIAMVLGAVAVHYFVRRFVDIPKRDFVAPIIAGVVASTVLAAVSQIVSGDGIVVVVGTALATTAFIATLIALERSLLIGNLSVIARSLRARRSLQESSSPGREMPISSANIEGVAPIWTVKDDL